MVFLFFSRVSRVAHALRCSLIATGVLFGLVSVSAGPALIVVQGSEGEPEFREPFEGAVEAWVKSAESGGVEVETILPEDDEQLARFLTALERQEKRSIDPLWLVMIGHGTYDQRDAKVNLNGDDLGSLALKEKLKDFERPVFVIVCASASGPFILEVGGPNRCVVTATKNGRQVNYSRFGIYMGQALTLPEADLDNDGQNSVLECFIHASKLTTDFYETEGRIVTEHALLDDNGDARGADAELLRGLYEGLPAGSDSDGLFARQWSLIPSEEERLLDPATRQARNALEQKLYQLNDNKSAMEEAAYYEKLEALMLELAQIYEAAGKQEPHPIPENKRDDPVDPEPDDASRESEPEIEAAEPPK